MIEVYALNDSIDNDTWLCNLLKDLKPLVDILKLVNLEKSITILEDNQATIKIYKDSENHQRTKA